MMENAGMVTFKYVKVEEDVSTITVNVVSTFLLALLVLPKMRETGRRFGVVPRLSVVGSFTHWLTTFPQGREERIFETLSDPKKVKMDDMCVPSFPSLFVSSPFLPPSRSPLPTTHTHPSCSY